MRPSGALSTIFILVLLLAMKPSLAASEERRYAFIVDNNLYENAGSLSNPKNDADQIEKILTKLGFQTKRKSNVTANTFANELDQFVQSIDRTERNSVLFYYAGHGMQYERQNWLVGTDAKLNSSTRLQFEAFKLNEIIETLERVSETTLVFWDACRDNPLLKNLRQQLKKMNRTRSAESLQSGAASVEASSGNTLITFSAAPGTKAYDGDGMHSPFAAALTQHMNTENLEVEAMLKRVKGDVLKSTGGAQQSEVLSRLTHEFYFNISENERNKYERKISELESQIALLRAKEQARLQTPELESTQSKTKPTAKKTKIGPTELTKLETKDESPIQSVITKPPSRDEKLAIDKFPIVPKRSKMTIPRTLAASPDGKLIAVGGHDGRVRILQSREWRLIATFSVGGERISQVSFSSDNKLLAAASRSGKIVIWSLTKNSLAREFHRPGESLYSVSINPDYPEKYVAAGSRNGKTYAWSLKSGKLLTNMTVHSGPVHAVFYKPGQRSWFYTAGGDGKIRYKPSKSSRRKSVSAHQGAIFDAKFSKKGSVLLTAGGDKVVKAWTSFPKSHRPMKLKGHLKYVLSAAISDNELLGASGGGDKKLLIWDLKNGELLRAITGHRSDIESIAFLPGTELVLSASEDKSLRVWSSTDGREVARIYFEKNGRLMLGLAPGGKIFGGPNAPKLFDAREFSEQEQSLSQLGLVLTGDALVD